jgi:ribosomal protein L13E
MNIPSMERKAQMAALADSARSVGIPIDERAEIRRLAAENKMLRRIIADYWKKRTEVDGSGGCEGD